MPLRILICFLIGKFVFAVSRLTGVGFGGTWPGEIALIISPDILSYFSRKINKGIILIAGTNGKTTCSLMVKSILETAGNSIVHNVSGANLLNGLVSSLISSFSFFPKNNRFDYCVFEIDENTLPQVLKKITPDIVVCLNLFRDQLDRYGEVDTIARRWAKALAKLPETSKVILNSDDPQIAYLGKNLKAKAVYFGVDDKNAYLKKPEHATDSIFCLNCQSRLKYQGFYYSHIGIWNCSKCGLKRPFPKYTKSFTKLPGFYNRYNAISSFACAGELGVPENLIQETLTDFSPAFGRQEEFIREGKKIKIFLSKNPAGFNQSLKTVLELNAANLLLILNDRIPDGRDISWIWDVDFENLKKVKNITLSGDRVYDLALRLKYAECDFSIWLDLKNAIEKAETKTNSNEILFVLPTYSAMLEIRKILTGRKIL